MSDSEKIEKAIEVIMQYGQIDGSHHRVWVLDQALRILAGVHYNELIEEYVGNDEYEWDCGIAP